MNEALLIAGMTAVTFAVRYPVMALVGKLDLPTAVLRALKYVPAAVLTAIITPLVFLTEDKGTLNLSPTSPALVGGITAALISWRTKSLIYTIVGGMGVFLLWTIAVGS